MSISQAELDHLAGEGVVVKTWYADPENKGQAKVYTSLPSDEELELWEDAAFTNGGPLVKIELVWAPDEAKKLAANSVEEQAKQTEKAGCASTEGAPE